MVVMGDVDIFRIEEAGALKELLGDRNTPAS
jgi:hypothetical protein